MPADDYYLLPPRNQKFYRLLGFFMTLMATGDKEWWGFKTSRNIYRNLYKFNSAAIMIIGPICVVSQLVYLFANFYRITFDVLGIILTICPVSIMINVKIFAAQTAKYKKVMKRFLGEFHLHNFKDQDAFVKMKLIKAERYIRWVSHLFFLLIICDSILWLVIPIINNIKNRDQVLNQTMPLQTCIYLWMPFDYSYNYHTWKYVHSCSIYLLLCGCSNLFIFDTINYAVIFHLVGHIEILKHKIVSQEWKGLNQNDVKRVLTNIIEYHSFVEGIYKDVEAAFGLNIGGIYLLNLIVDSMLLYQLLLGDKSTAVIYAIMIIDFMIALTSMSFILEEIKKQSDALSDALYNIPWEGMLVSNQKIVLLMLARAQPPLVFKAAGGIKTGVKPMMSIIKTTFSYYIMLKSTIH